MWHFTQVWAFVSSLDTFWDSVSSNLKVDCSFQVAHPERLKCLSPTPPAVACGGSGARSSDPRSYTERPITSCLKVVNKGQLVSTEPTWTKSIQQLHPTIQQPSLSPEDFALAKCVALGSLDLPPEWNSSTSGVWCFMTCFGQLFVALRMLASRSSQFSSSVPFSILPKPCLTTRPGQLSGCSCFQTVLANLGWL